MATYPSIHLQPGRDRRLRAGHPWAFASDLRLDAAAKALPPGSVVNLADAQGRFIGTGTFNFHSLIAARLFTQHPDAALDADFFAGRLRAALASRAKLYAEPYYRLIHAEGDGLPGFIVDRFGDVLAVQANTAGAETLLPALLAALRRELDPAAIVVRRDGDVRKLEGLETGEAETALGQVPAGLVVREGGLSFPLDPMAGQKTGWYFDLEPARGQMAQLAQGGTMLDLYCHTGAFGIRAAAAGAADVLCIDRSEPALALARTAAEANGVVGRCRFRRGEVFAELERLAGEKTRFDAVIADPPSFVKSKKELAAGARGYRKLARMAAAVTAPKGFLFIASCSHNMPDELFGEEVAAGIAAANRTGRILFSGGAGPDHPVPPQLPESAYIKYRILQLD